MNPNTPPPFEPQTFPLPADAAADIEAAVERSLTEASPPEAADPPDPGNWVEGTGAWAQSSDVVADIQAAVERVEALAGGPLPPSPPIGERMAAALERFVAGAREELTFDWTRWLFAGGRPPVVALAQLPFSGDLMIEDPPPRPQPRRAAGRSRAPHRPGREGIASPSATHDGWERGRWLVRHTTNRKMRRAIQASR